MSHALISKWEKKKEKKKKRKKRAVPAWFVTTLLVTKRVGIAARFVTVPQQTILWLQRMWTTLFNIFLTPIINAHILYGDTCHFASDHLILHIATLSWWPCTTAEPAPATVKSGLVYLERLHTCLQDTNGKLFFLLSQSRLFVCWFLKNWRLIFMYLFRPRVTFVLRAYWNG